MKRLLPYLPSPSIVFITGKRGSGKTAKAFSLASALHQKTGKPVYCHIPINVYLPSYFKPIDIHNPKPNSIWLIDDAHLLVHARKWYENTNILMDNFQTISRHLNVDIIYTTQETIRIDKNIIAGIDALVFCEPSLLAPQFERAAIHPLVEEAAKIFRRLPPHERKRTAYIITHSEKIILKNIKLPYYWSERLSKSFSNYLSRKREKKPKLIIKIIR